MRLEQLQARDLRGCRRRGNGAPKATASGGGGGGDGQRGGLDADQRHPLQRARSPAKLREPRARHALDDCEAMAVLF